MLTEVSKAANITTVPKKSIEAGNELRRMVLNSASDAQKENCQCCSTLLVLHVVEAFFRGESSYRLASMGAGPPSGQTIRK